LEITNRNVPLECDEQRIRPQQSEVNRLIADNTLIRSLTQWRTETSFRKGLEQTAEWVARNLEHFNARAYAR
jgi:nucleoside-diphosphate-sugar epimerase